MRMPKRGQKGFTLIELLIVVAILGILAAVIIPNVTRFMGRGEDEARRTEKKNVELAVTMMMTENSLSNITDCDWLAIDGAATNEMTKFPSDTEWPLYGGTDNYVSLDKTVYYYTCERNGQIRQWDDAICTKEFTD